MDDLPNITKRIKKLIDHYADGNVAEFVRLTKMSSHQVLNRLFNVDKRSGKYPNPSSGILTSIQTHLTDVNHKWLLAGEGQMLLGSMSETEAPLPVNDANELLITKNKLIASQEARIKDLESESERLKKELKECEEKIFKDVRVPRDA